MVSKCQWHSKAEKSELLPVKIFLPKPPLCVFQVKWFSQSPEALNPNSSISSKNTMKCSISKELTMQNSISLHSFSFSSYLKRISPSISLTLIVYQLRTLQWWTGQANAYWLQTLIILKGKQNLWLQRWIGYTTL